MTKYRMLAYEPTVFVEIYLPKRTLYQPLLFDILTKGFDLDYVKKHFWSKSKRKSIVSFLSGNPAWANFDKFYVDKLQEFFVGYSLYEVDGVYKGQERNNPIIEERTQIVRLVFRIDVAQVLKESRSLLNDYEARALIGDYLRFHHRGKTEEVLDKAKKAILDVVEDWREQIGFFTFGYIIFELCSGIESLFEQDQIPKTEEEIWVTHLADVELDRVFWSPNRGS